MVGLARSGRAHVTEGNRDLKQASKTRPASELEKRIMTLNQPRFEFILMIGGKQSELLYLMMSLPINKL